MTKEELSPADVTSLCAAGRTAWEKLGPRGKQAAFTWRGGSYIAKHNGMRLTVDDAAGRPIACRYE